MDPKSPYSDVKVSRRIPSPGPRGTTAMRVTSSTYSSQAASRSALSGSQMPDTLAGPHPNSTLTCFTGMTRPPLVLARCMLPNAGGLVGPVG